MRSSWLCVAFAALSGTVVAQIATAPPLPLQEQFVAGTGLKATLRLSSSAFGLGQMLTMWVTLENTGTKRLRIPGVYGTARLISTATGRAAPLGNCSFANAAASPLVRVRTMPSLAPRRKREFEFVVGCGPLRMQLPPGHYQVQAALWNYAGFPRLYDVYEQGADEVWEGTLPMPPVNFIMLPAQIASSGSDSRPDTAAASPPAAAAADDLFPSLSDVDFLEPPPESRHLGDYLRTVIDGGGDDAWSLARRGISRFGDKAVYAPLRAALASNDGEQQYRAGVALAALTFTHDVADGTGNFISPSAWDVWWKRNGARSREEWARDALKRQDTADETLFIDQSSPAARAADYLVTSYRGDQRIVSELSQHRSWRVRLATAHALASFDQRHAGELMVRELRNRYISACETASGRLRQLTDIGYTFNCSDPVERERGIDHWRAEVDRLSR